MKPSDPCPPEGKAVGVTNRRSLVRGEVLRRFALLFLGTTLTSCLSISVSLADTTRNPAQRNRELTEVPAIEVLSPPQQPQVFVLVLTASQWKALQEGHGFEEPVGISPWGEEIPSTPLVWRALPPAEKDFDSQKGSARRP